MNRLAPFLHYAQKVFGLQTQLRGVRSHRPQAQIPTTPVLLSLVLGVVTRVSSYLNLAHQTRRRRWQHLCGLKAPLSDDTFEYVTDAEGHTHPEVEFHHRYVFAQINGPKLNVVLDLEPIRPGEDECAAALRLLGRLRRVYGPRFVDAITVDAWYAKGPFLRAVEKLGWWWVVVLKRQDMDVYQEAQHLSQGQRPCAAFEDAERQRQVQLWEVKQLDFSDGYGAAVRVVRSEERWVETQVRGGRRRREPQASQWVWAACAALDGYGARVIYDSGHRRWGIENKAFNELTQAYRLDHCYHHEPTSTLGQMLILLLGFVLFTAFAQLHSKLVGLGKLTTKAPAQELNLALEEDLPWELWFASG